MVDRVSAKQHLANQIKNNRVQMGWSQAKLAELVGVNSASTIGNWEACLAAPDYDKLCFLADLFKVTTDQLLGRDISVSKQADPEYDVAATISSQENSVKYECCDEIGRAAIDNCIDFHYKRCISFPSAKTKSNSSTRYEKLFVNQDDAEYDVMLKQMDYLKTLRKNSKKSYMDITNYLWNIGYGDEICLAFVLNMFGIGISKRVPCQRLYDDVQAFLKGNYTIVSNVKSI